MFPTMDFPMARHFLRSWTYEVFWPRHVTSAETPREIVKVSNLQSRFTQNPCFISFIPVGSSWYSFIHKGSLLRVAYDLQPVVKCSWSFWSFAIPVELGESVEIECRNPDIRTYPIILTPLQFLTNGKNMTSTLQNIGYQFPVAALSFHLLFMKHWGGGGKVSFKYPANIVGEICPPWPPPQCHEFCRILWAHWCSHLVAPMFPSNQGGFPSPFCFFFSTNNI